ncbi:hypothetical protein TNCV_1022281 [Trichonephila clavipes]|nr:hypothetical protein TNCV_1022281 [Trichonephila clavipes]
MGDDHLTVDVKITSVQGDFPDKKEKQTRKETSLFLASMQRIRTGHVPQENYPQKYFSTVQNPLLSRTPTYMYPRLWRKRRQCVTFKVVKSLRNVIFRDRCIYQRVLKAPQYTSTELQQHIQNILDALKQTRAIIIQLQANSFHPQLPLTGCH